MTPELELDRTDYHLRLMIERMQRDGRSQAAIEKAVRIASRSNRSLKRARADDNHASDRQLERSRSVTKTEPSPR